MGGKIFSVLVPYVSNKKCVGEYTQLTVVPSGREKLDLFFFFFFLELRTTLMISYQLNKADDINHL